MRLARTVRRWIASALVMVFVGLQLATAAYACAAGTGTPGSNDWAQAMAAMPDCAEMEQSLDPGDPQLCKAHCDQNKQSVNSSPAATDPAGAQVVDWLLSRLLLQPPLAEPAPTGTKAGPSGPPKGAPPAYLAYLVLRN